MLFYAIVITFLMTLLMSKVTITVMDDLDLNENHVIYWNKV